MLPDHDRPRELRIVCTNLDCDFNGDRPLPILAVDEPIYRRLPAFLIATVDKFATLPWIGSSGALLGGADRADSTGFYGAAEPGQGTPLVQPLPGPDLVIQDELHLISGPLGTMAGLYETAIEALCVAGSGEDAVRPKIVASTATVRRAQDQIQALFARPRTQIFPPPGPDRRDSFFARVVPATELPARLYVGVAAQGRNPKVVMRKVWLGLMGAAQRAYFDGGGFKNTANPAARPSVPREGSRRLRDRDEHDLGRARHPAARPDGRARAAEDRGRVHPGDQPRRAHRRGAGTCHGTRGSSAGSTRGRRWMRSRRSSIRVLPASLR